MGSGAGAEVGAAVGGTCVAAGGADVGTVGTAVAAGGAEVAAGGADVAAGGKAVAGAAESEPQAARANAPIATGQNYNNRLEPINRQTVNRTQKAPIGDQKSVCSGGQVRLHSNYFR